MTLFILIAAPASILHVSDSFEPTLTFLFSYNERTERIHRKQTILIYTNQNLFTLATKKFKWQTLSK